MPILDELTADWLKSNYLQGIDLTDDENIPFPDSIYLHPIRSSLELTEAEFHLTFDMTHLQGQRYDATDADASSFFLMHLKQRPLREVTKLEMRYADFPAFELPVSWLQIASAKAGQIHIMPGQDTGSGHLLGQRIPQIGIMGNFMRPFTPRWWRVDYWAGFSDRRYGVSLGAAALIDFNSFGPLTVRPSVKADTAETYTVSISGTSYTGEGDSYAENDSDTEVLTWTPTDFTRKKVTAKTWRMIDQIDITTDGASTPTFDFTTSNMVPEYFLELVGLKAAELALDTAGDLIFGAGVSSKSHSVDGLSTSVSTTSSPTNAGFGAKIHSYRKKREALKKAVRRSWTMPKMLIV